MFESTGKLICESDKIFVLVDLEISRYARALVPEKINAQRYAPHITVVRNELFVSRPNLNNTIINFKYNNIVQVGKVYYWLEVYSDKLTEIRLELGLNPSSEFSRPPDNSDCFHITIGNLKR